jgi:hypothetical protein
VARDQHKDFLGQSLYALSPLIFGLKRQRNAILVREVPVDDMRDNQLGLVAASIHVSTSLGVSAGIADYWSNENCLSLSRLTASELIFDIHPPLSFGINLDPSYVVVFTQKTWHDLAS